MQNMMNFPKDLTPGQRARLKFAWHVAFVVAFNGILAAIALLDQNRNGIDWQVLAISVISQMALALFDAMKKYVAASGDVPLSTMLDIVRAEVAARAPAVKYNANEQALQSVAANLFAPTMQYSAIPKDLSANTSSTTSAPPAQAPTDQHPPIDASVETVSTLPNIAAIQARQVTAQG